MPIPLSRKQESETGTEWVNLNVDDEFTAPLQAGKSRFLAVAVRRADRTSASQLHASYLEITDGSAPTARLRLPVRMDTEDSTALFRSSIVSSELTDPISGSLWVGEAVINQVNAPSFSDTNLLETASPYNLRLIVHNMDESDQNYLLQSALIALSPDDVDPSGLFTNSSYKVFSGLNPTLPTDLSQARRISSSAFPVMEPLLLSGTFGTNLIGTLTIPANDPQNPFYHRYHPKHDNRDGRFNAFTNAVESQEIVRTITFEFDQPGTNSSATIFGDAVSSGTYRETLEGLRKDPIITEGFFQMTRILDGANLNN